MRFNLGRNNECTDCILEPLSKGAVVRLESVIFRASSVKKIADIFVSGVKRDNQELVIDSIVCKKEEYQKLEDKRYRATFITLADAGNNYITALEFVLGNINLSYDIRNVSYESDYVEINLANMTVYPFGSNSWRELDD